MTGLLNAVASIAGATQGLSNLAGSISNLASGNYAAVLSGLGAWADGMQVASWRGIPFAVKESTIRKGRRQAAHIYPFRDQVWVEDLGRGVRRYGFRGFLVGDDVLQQSSAMQAAAEGFGPGTLIHPTIGSLTCSVTEFTARQTERGRVIEIEFEFVETSASLYPALVQSTQQGVQIASTSTLAAMAADFNADAAAPLAEGVRVVAGATQTVASWASLATRLSGDAGLLTHSVAGLVGNYGRYNSASMTLQQPTTASVASLLSGITTARTVVSASAASAGALAALL